MVSVVYGECSVPFTCEKVHAWFQQPADFDEDKLSSGPPTKPSGNTYYVYRFDNTKNNKDWFADTYCYKNMGNIRYYPKDSKLLKKSRYCVKDASGSGYNTGFTRIVFEMQTESSPTYVVVQYLGDHTLSIPRPHGNSKQQTLPFHATTASVRTEAKTLVQHNTARNVYIQQTLRTDIPQEYQGRQNARNQIQMKNTRQWYLNSQKMGPDPLYSIHIIAKELPGYVHKLDTINDFICIFAMPQIIDMVNVILKDEVITFGYDTTFEVGDFYSSVLLFRHPYIQGNPGVPLAILLHENKKQASHSKFMKKVGKLVPALKTTPSIIVMDRERSLTNAVKENWCNCLIVYCWNHLLRDITEWAANHQEKHRSYREDVRRLLHSCDEITYHRTADSLKLQWSLAFLKYYTTYIEKDIIANCGCWVIKEHGLYDAHSGITSNVSESYNNVIKSFLCRKEVTPDVMLLKVYELQSYCLNEIRRWIAGCGNYRAIPGMEQKLTSCVNKDMDVANIEHVKRSVQLQANSRAEHYSKKPHACDKEVAPALIDHMTYTDSNRDTPRKPSIQHTLAVLACEQGQVEYVKRWNVYFVKGEARYHHVKLEPRAACTCHGPKECFHIIAAQITAGTYEQQKEKKWGLTITQMMKRKRMPMKRSGRKKPRKCDVDLSDSSFSQESIDVSSSLSRKVSEKLIAHTNETKRKGGLLRLKRGKKKGLIASDAIPVNASTINTPQKTTEEVVKNRQNQINDPDVSSAVWIKELNLDEKERKLIENVKVPPTNRSFGDGWLTDKSLEAASNLLKQQFPNVSGLSSPVMAPFYVGRDASGNKMFNWMEGDKGRDTGRVARATGDKHVQMYSNLFKHWVCSSRGIVAGDGVSVCDSLSSNNRGHLGRGLEIQLGQVYGTPNSTMHINVLHSDQQENSSDCGLFAIANATMFCFKSIDNDKSWDMHQYDHDAMRPHLIECFQNRRMEEFPTIKRGIPRQILRVADIELGCATCSLPTYYAVLVTCEACRLKIHHKCAKRLIIGHTDNTDSSNGTQSWYCAECFAVIS